MGLVSLSSMCLLLIVTISVVSFAAVILASNPMILTLLRLHRLEARDVFSMFLVMALLFMAINGSNQRGGSLVWFPLSTYGDTSDVGHSISRTSGGVEHSETTVARKMGAIKGSQVSPSISS